MSGINVGPSPLTAITELINIAETIDRMRWTSLRNLSTPTPRETLINYYRSMGFTDVQIEERLDGNQP